VGFITFYDYSDTTSPNRSDMELCPKCCSEFKKWKAK
jgi:hypothetical protein